MAPLVVPLGDPEQQRIAALVMLAQQATASRSGRSTTANVDSVYRYLYYRVGRRSWRRT
jgi:hypothetical protein